MSVLQVAQKAGVSHTTVANVINRREGVTPETVARVTAAMKELGYRPQAPNRRRGPRPARPGNGSKFRVSVLWYALNPQLMTHVGQQLLAGAAREAANCDVELTIEYVDPQNMRMGQLLSKFATIDGFLLYGDVPDSLRGIISDYPCVMLNSRGNLPQADRVRPNHEQIGQLAYQYLVEKGCTRLAMVNLTPDHPALKIRTHAFVQAAAEAGRELCTLQPTAQADLTAEQAAEMLAQLDDGSLGVFFLMDQFAAQVYAARQRSGLPPARWHAIGCDNDASALQGLHPRPATFCIQPEVIGIRAMDQLLWRLRNPGVASPVVILVPPRLVPAAD